MSWLLDLMIQWNLAWLRVVGELLRWDVTDHPQDR